MNAAKLKAVAAPVVEVTAVDRARAAYDDLARELNDITDATRRAESATMPVEQGASDATTLRQRLGRLLMQTRGATTTETDAIDRELEMSERAARRAAAFAEARDADVGELQAQANALLPQLQDARKALAVAQFEAAGAEISQQLIHDLRAAAEHYGGAYARLVAAGRAHTELARRLREHFGVTLPPFGVEFPATAIKLHPIGFGINDGGMFNVLTVDVGSAIEAALVEFMKRWGS